MSRTTGVLFAYGQSHTCDSIWNVYTTALACDLFKVISLFPLTKSAHKVRACLKGLLRTLLCLCCVDHWVHEHHTVDLQMFIDADREVYHVPWGDWANFLYEYGLDFSDIKLLCICKIFYSWSLIKSVNVYRFFKKKKQTRKVNRKVSVPRSCHHSALNKHIETF